MFLLGQGGRAAGPRPCCSRVKTRFQYSTNRSQSQPGRQSGSEQPCSGPRSKYSSEQGPQGPVGPTGPQKLALRGSPTMRSRGTPSASQSAIASFVGLDLVVALEVRDPDEVGIELQVVEGELPREADGPLFEVVAHREVAEHLEEGAMPRGQPHLVDVGSCGSTSARW